MKPVPEYEDLYLVGEDGSIIRRETGRVLRPSVNPQTGYLYVSLWRNNQGRSFAVHRLVALAHIPNPDLKPYVNHKNSNRQDPHKDNLEWCTQSENIQHGYQFGHMSQEARRRFKDFELDMLLQTFLAGVSMTAIAIDQQCGLSRLTINLRKHATDTGQLEAFTDELKRQKQARNSKANAAYRRRVLQFSLEGEFISEHESLTAAARSLGKNTSGSISNALNPNHPQQKAFGYLWKFA